jgi:hypothetical protein
MSFFEKLKERWGITSNWRLLKICFIFAITGLSSVQVRKVLFPLLGVTSETPVYLKVILWIVFLMPAYYLFMMLYAILFREKDFFFGMMGKTFSRFRRNK